MAYYGSGYVPPSGSVFGGYLGGYNQTPEGFIFPSNTNTIGLGYSSVPGLDPINYYPGVAHYWPPTTLIESQRVVDPNFGIISEL
ncbi:unnamed protein product [Adineta steineri]|uniref:Uncharacterized protein n=1 Tax=Adineta steineri TaxID=433720 RepID=A0A814SAD4_9BILA|nr:unnamed protein product [Adineta steineri]CAF1174539.1 unnamed protein product [Adineta steineri]CAF1228973.1 unnamed protein product [Adineta steineri]CAF3673244.1 unnamed protein product [Adineta steineri]CAF3687846.1 unnamed protein product [Adineta steineri]